MRLNGVEVSRWHHHPYPVHFERSRNGKSGTPRSSFRLGSSVPKRTRLYSIVHQGNLVVRSQGLVLEGIITIRVPIERWNGDIIHKRKIRNGFIHMLEGSESRRKQEEETSQFELQRSESILFINYADRVPNTA